jgi:hypothetical protein
VWQEGILLLPVSVICLVPLHGGNSKGNTERLSMGGLERGLPRQCGRENDYGCTMGRVLSENERMHFKDEVVPASSKPSFLLDPASSKPSFRRTRPRTFLSG